MRVRAYPKRKAIRRLRKLGKKRLVVSHAEKAAITSILSLKKVIILWTSPRLHPLLYAGLSRRFHNVPYCYVKRSRYGKNSERS